MLQQNSVTLSLIFSAFVVLLGVFVHGILSINQTLGNKLAEITIRVKYLCDDFC